MAKEVSKWTLGIGAQVDQATPLAAVRDATGLITGPASGVDATGILLREDTDISLAMNRLSDSLGMATGSLSRLGSAFQSTEPVCSFTIDMMGNRLTTTAGAPVAGDFDLDEYMLRILEGARLSEGTPTGSGTNYNLTGTQEYQTLKVWRSTESWTLVGCTFGLSWALVPGEKCKMTISVFADSVIHNDTEVFPTTDLATAFGNQLGAPPILQLAAAQVDAVTRGIQSATLSIDHEQQQVPDSNVTTGIINSQGERTVSMTADWYVDDAADDFTNLEADLPAEGTSPLRLMVFNLGQPAGALETANAFRFSIQNFEYETLGEVVNGNDSVRTIAGHAVVAGANGVGSGIDDEFNISSL